MISDFENQLYGAFRVAGISAAPRRDGSGITFCCPRCVTAVRLEVADGRVSCPDCGWSAEGAAWAIAAAGKTVLPASEITVLPASEIADAFKTCIIPYTKLAELAMTPRERVFGDWFKEADLGFIFAPRGLGKTWLSLAMAAAIANGRECGPWVGAGARRVLYVDGEMPCESIAARIAGMDGVENLAVLNHEALFHLSGKVLNLADPVMQAALTERMQADGVKVLILDNLSSLFSGMKENDADSWEIVLPWMLTLRRLRIAVVVVHHAGRNNQMRGTSRREDAAFWVIRLDEVQGEQRDGARFLSRFTKDRNSQSEQPATLWSFTTARDGRVTIKTEGASTMQVFRQWIEDGLDSAEDIAREMGVSKGTVSKMAKRAMAEGWLKKNGRRYAIES